MFRCWFLAIVDVRTIYRYHANNASPVKWCLNEKVELLCKLAMPRLSSRFLVVVVLFLVVVVCW